jgi:hypothetical protein
VKERSSSLLLAGADRRALLVAVAHHKCLIGSSLLMCTSPVCPFPPAWKQRLCMPAKLILANLYTQMVHLSLIQLNFWRYYCLQTNKQAWDKHLESCPLCMWWGCVEDGDFLHLFGHSEPHWESLLYIAPPIDKKSYRKSSDLNSKENGLWKRPLMSLHTLHCCGKKVFIMCN